MVTKIPRLELKSYKNLLNYLNIDFVYSPVKSMKDRNSFSFKVNQHIAKNLHKNDYQIQDLCGLVCLSRSQVYRKIKQEMGVTFSALLNNARLQKAISLLKNGQNNISTIANQTGFRDSSYFVKVFKRAYGTTPSKYRDKSHCRTNQFYQKS